MIELRYKLNYALQAHKSLILNLLQSRAQRERIDQLTQQFVYSVILTQ